MGPAKYPSLKRTVVGGIELLTAEEQIMNILYKFGYLQGFLNRCAVLEHGEFGFKNE